MSSAARLLVLCASFSLLGAMLFGQAQAILGSADVDNLFNGDTAAHPAAQPVVHTGCGRHHGGHEASFFRIPGFVR